MVRLLQACWATIGKHIKQIFKFFLDYVYSLNVFIHAELAIIPKAGHDLLTPMFCGQSLLLCLRKGLERVLFKRIVRLATKNQVVSQRLLWDFSRRPYVDLILCVIHEAEVTMQNIRGMVMVTLSTYGALDAVLHEHLLNRICGQGWPRKICTWMESLHDRKIYPSYCGRITEEKQLCLERLKAHIFSLFYNDL